MTDVTIFGLPTMTVEIVGDHVHCLTAYFFETSRVSGPEGHVSHYAAQVYAWLPFGSKHVYRNEGATSVPISRLIVSGSKDGLLEVVPRLFAHRADTKAAWSAFIGEHLLKHAPSGRILVLWISEDGASETAFVVKE